MQIAMSDDQGPHQIFEIFSRPSTFFQDPISFGNNNAATRQ